MLNVLIMTQHTMRAKNVYYQNQLPTDQVALIMLMLIGIFMILCTFTISCTHKKGNAIKRIILMIFLVIVGLSALGFFRREENIQLNLGVIDNVGCYYKMHHYLNKYHHIHMRSRKIHGVIYVPEDQLTYNLYKKKKQDLDKYKYYRVGYRNKSHNYNGTSRIHIKKFHYFQI